MLQLENVKMEFGHNVLFEDVNLSLNPGSRYGVVGANGSGKSTLLKLIAGKIAPIDGQIRYPNRYKISFLEQNQFEFEKYDILDVVLMGRPKVWKLLKKQRQFENQSNISAQEGQELAKISTEMERHKGYGVETKAAAILHGLGLPNDQLKDKMETLSGGYKLRVLLAQCLFSQPDVLLLDEPNNHLDLQSIAWLGNYLEQFPGIAVVVSHDHHFLNQISTHILDIDYETIRMYNGDYEYFKKEKEKERERKKREIAKQEKKKKEMEEFINKFKAKATKARQALSKKKQMEKMEEIEIKRSSRQSPFFSFREAGKSGQKIVYIDSLNKSYGDKQVLQNLNLKIKRGDRIAILGPNGIGKTTLLKILIGELEKDSGKIDWGQNISYGYYAQDHSEQIPARTTPYQWLEDQFPLESIGTLKSSLGKMLFPEEDMDRVAASLSGGEAARLVFARLTLQKTNLLILDEPTNHLDLESIEALVDTLKDYSGTIIFVSHDRYFVERLADQIFEMTTTGYQYFSGNYSQFINSKGQDYLDRDIDLSIKDSQPQTDKSSEKKKQYVQERRARKKEHSRLKKKIKHLEEKIHDQENRLEEIDKQLFSESARSDHNKLEKLSQEKEEIENSLMELMEKWERIHQKYEQLENLLQEFDEKIAALKN
ncbi:MAG TPA: ABC-F family ATP-binding cassette domain-containing protein [bacterium]|nr:ABC-F family ATP-binding cassette domain-containing protein [bacterium]